MPFPDRRRNPNAPSDRLARIGWLLIKLLFNGAVDYAEIIDRFGISRREFQRDLRELRTIGRDHGFSISRTKGGRVFLDDPRRRAWGPAENARHAPSVVAGIARALGGPIEHELRAAVPIADGEGRRGFLELREPTPAASERVVATFEFLKSAAAGPARVEFAYTSARGDRTERRVEPYHIVVRSARYYLVAYDLVRRDWRYFGPDAIGRPMRKAGTFPPRPVPERFLAQQAVGWIRGRRRSLATREPLDSLQLD